MTVDSPLVKSALEAKEPGGVWGAPTTEEQPERSGKH